MNTNEFKKYLKDRDISFKISKNKLIINGGDVYLQSLTSLSEGVEFNNGGCVYLRSLTSLSEGVEFNNGGYVDLRSLTSLPEGVEFNNGGDVYLRSLTSLPEGIEFNNGGGVHLHSLTSLPEGVKFNNGGYVHLRSLTSLPEGIEFNNGGDVYLRSLTSLPEDFEFNNGGGVHLQSKTIKIIKSYLTRFKIKIKNNYVILYKKVSKDYKTQEGTDHETDWKIGTVNTHPNWDPRESECGAGKFHACARPFWCDIFREKNGDKYIAVRIHVDDLFEWKNSPTYPQKIGFRKGEVLYKVDRMGNKTREK